MSRNIEEIVQDIGSTELEYIPHLQIEATLAVAKQIERIANMLESCIGSASGINVTLCASNDTIPVRIYP